MFDTRAVTISSTVIAQLKPYKYSRSQDERALVFLCGRGYRMGLLSTVTFTLNDLVKM